MKVPQTEDRFRLAKTLLRLYATPNSPDAVNSHPDLEGYDIDDIKGVTRALRFMGFIDDLSGELRGLISITNAGNLTDAELREIAEQTQSPGESGEIFEEV